MLLLQIQANPCIYDLECLAGVRRSYITVYDCFSPTEDFGYISV